MQYTFLDTDGKPALVLEPTDNGTLDVAAWMNGFKYTLSKKTAKTLAKAINQLTKPVKA